MAPRTEVMDMRVVDLEQAHASGFRVMQGLVSGTPEQVREQIGDRDVVLVQVGPLGMHAGQCLGAEYAAYSRTMAAVPARVMEGAAA